MKVFKTLDINVKRHIVHKTGSKFTLTMGRVLFTTILIGNLFTPGTAAAALEERDNGT